MKQRTLVLAIACSLFASPAGWSAASKPDHAPGGRLFRLRLPFEPATLDWNLGDVPIAIVQNAMRGLYRVDENGKIVPDLVAEATQRDGGKTWVFTFKTGVKWSDGVPFKAQHAAESLRRLLSPLTASTYAYFLFDIENAKAFHERKAVQPGIRALNDTTLELKLEHEVPYLPAILTHWVTYPVRQDLISQWPDYWSNPERIATLGAYRIKEWQHHTRIVMVPNPYAGAEPGGRKPWFQRIEAWIVPDDNTAVNLYDTGHLEFMSDPGQSALKHPDLTHKPSPILYFIGIGKGHPLTKSRAGIQALSHALNRTEIPQLLNAPHRPALDLCPPEIWSLIGLVQTGPGSYAAQPELAREFLKEAGFDDGKKVPPIQLKYFNRPAIADVAQWLQAQWKKNLGVTVELEAQEPKTYWSWISEAQPAFFMNSKGASYPDPDAFFRLFAGGNPQNVGRWSDPEYDAWTGEAGQTRDQATRRELYLKADRRVLLERPGLIPLYFRDTGYLIKPFVKGVVINPLTSVDFASATYGK